MNIIIDLRVDNQSHRSAVKIAFIYVYKNSSKIYNQNAEPGLYEVSNRKHPPLLVPNAVQTSYCHEKSKKGTKFDIQLTD